MAKGKSSLRDKVGSTYADLVETYSSDELEHELLRATKSVIESEGDRDEDEKLNAAKEEVKLLASAFNDVIKLEKNKIKYCIQLMKSRGVS